MKFHKLTIFLMLSFGLVQAQNELFEEANQSYLNGEYAQAILKYEQLQKNDLLSENIYYNLGNAYYKTDKVGQSILNFEKALKLNPGNKKIEHNLSLAYLKTKDKIEPLPQLSFVSWWYQLLSQCNASQWSKRAVFSAFFSLFLLISYKFYKKSSLKYLGILSIVLSLSFAFLAHKKYQYDHVHQFAILMLDETKLKETPNESSNLVATIHEGLKVEVLDQVDDWSKVKLDDGVEGWLLSKLIAQI